MNISQSDFNSVSSDDGEGEKGEDSEQGSSVVLGEWLNQVKSLTTKFENHPYKNKIFQKSFMIDYEFVHINVIGEGKKASQHG